MSKSNRFNQVPAIQTFTSYTYRQQTHNKKTFFTKSATVYNKRSQLASRRQSNLAKAFHQRPNPAATTTFVLPTFYPSCPLPSFIEELAFKGNSCPLGSKPNSVKADRAAGGVGFGAISTAKSSKPKAKQGKNNYKSAARLARKSRQRHQAKNYSSPVSTQARAAKRSALKAKAERKYARDWKVVWSDAITNSYAGVLPCVERCVPKPILRRKPVRSAVVFKPIQKLDVATKVRRRAVENASAFEASNSAAAFRAVNAQYKVNPWEHLLERAAEIRRAQEQKVASAIGATPTKTVVAQDLNQSAPAEKVIGYNLFEDPAWLNDRGDYAASSDDVKPTSEVPAVVAMEEPMTIAAPVEVEPIELIEAQAVQVIENKHIKLAQTQALAPELEAVFNRRPQAYYAIEKAVKNAFVIGRADINGSAHNRIGLPTGWKVGMSYAVPIYFGSKGEPTGERNEEGKEIWTDIDQGIIPGLDMLAVVGQNRGDELKWAYLKLNSKERNALNDKAYVALSDCGFTKEQCSAYAKGVAQTCFYLGKAKCRILVPSEFKAVLDVVVPAAYKEVESKLALVFYIDTNWVKPAHGLTYKRIAAVFRVLEQGIQEAGFSNVLSQRPLTFIEGEDSFTIYFGAHLSIACHKDGQVYVNDLALGNKYMVQHKLVACHKFYGELTADELVVLNPFDVLFYMMENYHLIDINRTYPVDKTGKVRPDHADRQSMAFHHSTETFVKKAYPLQMVQDWWTPSFAIERFASSATVVMTGLPGLLCRADEYTRDSNGKPLTVKRVIDKTKFQKLIAPHRRRAALMSSYPDAICSEVDSRRVIEAAFAHGFIIQTYGSCDSFAKASLYTLSPLDVRAQKQKQFILAVCKNGWTEKLVKKFGDYSEESAVRFLESLIGTGCKLGSAEFWGVVVQELVILNSTKPAKFTSRVDKMQYPVDLPLEGMEYSRVLTEGSSALKMVKPARFVLALGIPVQPGMSFVRKDFLKGHYITTGFPQTFVNPADNALRLVPELAELAEPCVTSTGLKSFKFEGVFVEEGGLIGYYIDAAGLEFPVFAEETAELIEVRFGNKKELTETLFYVTCRYRYGVDVHKARLNIKANLAVAKIDNMLMLNQTKFAADVLIMSDAFKASDLTNRGIYDYIGETFCRNEKYADLVREANRFAGVPNESEVFYYNDKARKSGCYAAMYETFVADFGKDIWWTSPVSSDFRRLLVETYTSMAEAGYNGWRFASAAKVPVEGLDGRIPADAVVFTNGGESIESGANILCFWEEDGIQWTAMRGFGFAGTEENPLWGPMLSEYSAIEQSVGTQSILGFDAIDLSLRGYDQLAADLTHKSSSRFKFFILQKTLGGSNFSLDGAAIPTIDVTAETELFSQADKETLRDLEEDRVAWLVKIAELKSNVTYRFALDEKRKISLYLPALMRVFKHGTVDSSESMLRDLYNLLRMLYNGYSPADLGFKSSVAELAGRIDCALKSETTIKGLSQGGTKTGSKAASLPILSMGEVVVLKDGEVHKECRAGGYETPEFVAQWRSPIRNAVFSKFILLDESAIDTSTEFGRLYNLGWYEIDGYRTFDFNNLAHYGDYDGDGTSWKTVVNVEPTTYDVALGFLDEVAGNMRTAKFWANPKSVKQFYADHYYASHKNELLGKLAFDASKALISRAALVDFLKSATEIQAKAVGKIYRVSAIHEMMAEILSKPAVAELVKECAWFDKFEYLTDAAKARKASAVIETIYEQLLGGFAPEMVGVILGNLVRAVDAQDQTEWHTLKALGGRLNDMSDLGAIDPALAGERKFTKVVAAEAKESLAEMGYSSAWLETFERAAMMAGFARDLATLPDELYWDYAEASPELVLMLSIQQIVMSASQGRKWENHIARLIARVNASIKEQPNLAALAWTILNETQTGRLAQNLMKMGKAINNPTADIPAKTVKKWAADNS